MVGIIELFLVSLAWGGKPTAEKILELIHFGFQHPNQMLVSFGSGDFQAMFQALLDVGAVGFG
jgi:hypothetical protein